jgi:hypothetical protein
MDLIRIFVAQFHVHCGLEIEKVAEKTGPESPGMTGSRTPVLRAQLFAAVRGGVFLNTASESTAICCSSRQFFYETSKNGFFRTISRQKDANTDPNGPE